MNRVDSLIERIIKNKFRNLDNAKKDKRIKKILKDEINISNLSKREKDELISILAN